MKTKSELMAELEKDAEVIRKHFSSAGVGVTISDKEFRRTLMISIDDYSPEGAICGSEFEYRPDPVAPAKGRIIIDQAGNILVSRGDFIMGSLRCSHSPMFDSQAFRENWCDYLNRDHHSPGWQKEWEPKE